MNVSYSLIHPIKEDGEAYFFYDDPWWTNLGRFVLDVEGKSGKWWGIRAQVPWWSQVGRWMNCWSVPIDPVSSIDRWSGAEPERKWLDWAEGATNKSWDFSPRKSVCSSPERTALQSNHKVLTRRLGKTLWLTLETKISRPKQFLKSENQLTFNFSSVRCIDQFVSASKLIHISSFQSRNTHFPS